MFSFSEKLRRAESGVCEILVYVILESWDDPWAPPGAVYPCLKFPCPHLCPSMWDLGRFWPILQFSADFSGLEVIGIIVDYSGHFFGRSTTPKVFKGGYGHTPLIGHEFANSGSIY